MSINMTKEAMETATVHGSLLAEACRFGGCDVADYLEAPDDYPAVMDIDGAEYAAGYFVGLADAFDVSPRALWSWALRALPLDLDESKDTYDRRRPRKADGRPRAGAGRHLKAVPAVRSLLEAGSDDDSKARSRRSAP